MTKGFNLWKKAKKIIPGGNNLLSKRPERYAPDIWPNYFKSCRGVEVIDLEGNKYIDMAQMGLGSSILGYANPELTDAVCKSALDGVNCTLNCKEEVDLAEILLKKNKFAGGVKFARTGSEAMSISVRIARAYTGKTKIAFSGYHGWSDWYLSANLRGENLKDHLLPGLSTKGVPEGLANTAIPFKYNNINDLKKVLKENEDIGILCMEGARYDFPTEEFQNFVMKVCKEKKLLLILDEITSGWRLTDGGVYKLNKLDPDIVVYGKALGGGYAISAVVGKKEVMDVAQDTFISSTMMTERIGFVSAIKTIEIISRDKSWKHLNEMGNYIGINWQKIAEKYGLNLEITEFKPLITFKFKGYDNPNELITFFTQEMLNKGYLASTSVYLSCAHTKEIIDEYLYNLESVFKEMYELISKNQIKSKLKTKVRSDAFARLT